MNSKLFLLIFYSIISISFQKRILKEEDNNEDEQKTCEEEEEEKTSENEIDFSNIPSLKIRKENAPHSQVVLPIRRVGTSNSEIGTGPCGGIEKKSANTLTTKGSSINIIWEILVPENSGNCTVKISNGLQDIENFKLLEPIEGKLNEDGSFICGREKGFEHKEFKLPEDYECDGCTIQWKWSTSYGDIYSCSDIIINGGNLNKCMGKCLNGGSCFNGECLCVDGFTGEFCQYDEKSSSKTWLWILIGIICLIGLIYLGNKLYPRIKRLCKEGWTKSNIEIVKQPFPEGSGDRMQPEFVSNPDA
jgi:hypothetical protein